MLSLKIMRYFTFMRLSGLSHFRPGLLMVVSVSRVDSSHAECMLLPNSGQFISTGRGPFSGWQ